MAAPGTHSPARLPTRELAAVRDRTQALIAHLSRADLERVLDPLMSPLVWDLAHIAAYEDLWIGHRVGGLALLHPELAAMYDAFETPREVRGELPLLDLDGGAASTSPTSASARVDVLEQGLAPASSTSSSSSCATSSSTPRRCARR